jgi:hypothetical protein
MHRPRRNAAQFFDINDFGHGASGSGALWQVAVGRSNARPLRSCRKIIDLGFWCWLFSFLGCLNVSFLSG